MADITKNIFNLNELNVPNVHKSYSDFQKELLRLDTHNNLIKSVNKLRDDRIKKNNENINNLEADLITTRRQVEIIENRNFIKEELISTLKVLILIITLGVIINVYLKSTSYYTGSTYLLIFITIYYVGNKIMTYTKRSANRWTQLQWRPTGTPQDTVQIDDDDQCAVENAEYQASMNKIKNNILDKLISLKSRFKKLDDRKKLLMERKTTIKKDYTETVEETDVIIKKLPVDRLSEDKKSEFNQAKSKKLEDIQRK